MADPVPAALLGCLPVDLVRSVGTQRLAERRDHDRAVVRGGRHRPAAGEDSRGAFSDAGRCNRRCGAARAPILPRMKRALVLLALLATTLHAAPPDPAAVAAKARAWRITHERDIVSEFTTLLAIPNLASDAPNI